MIANLLDKNVIRVLGLFLISPGSRYIRKEVKEKTNMHNVPLDKTLNHLLTLRIIKQEKNLLMLNQENEFKEVIEKLRKEFIELNLPLKIYYLLLDISNKLIEINGIKSIYLFGSYAKLIFHEKSDVDLAIISGKKMKDKIERMVKNTAEKISRKQKKKIEVHFFTEEDMKAKDPLIKDILRNGKKIL